MTKRLPMGRPPGTSNVTPAEVKRIRSLFRSGAKILDIVEAVERSESVVMRVTRGMKRKKPTPNRGDNSKRNDRILRLVEKGLTREQVGDKVGLTARQISNVVENHPHIVWLLRVRKSKPVTVAQRFRMLLSTAERITAR